MLNDLPLVSDLFSVDALTHTRLRAAFQAGCPKTAHWIQMPGSRYPMATLTAQLREAIPLGLRIGMAEAILKGSLPLSFIERLGGSRLAVKLRPSIDFIDQGDIVQRVFLVCNLTLTRAAGGTRLDRRKGVLQLGYPNTWITALTLSLTELPNADSDPVAAVRIAPSFVGSVELPNSMPIRAVGPTFK